jgi:acetyltransferase-like isoleucine patch superfamily enzyme
MLSTYKIDALRKNNIDARWLNVVDGAITIERHSVVKHLRCLGSCRFGAFSYTDEDVAIYDTEIGRYCSIGSGVRINPGQHPPTYLTTHPIGIDPTGEAAGLGGDAEFQRFRLTAHSRAGDRERSQRSSVGNDVWIGTNAILLNGVSVGHGAIVGAGAVVTQPVRPFAIVAGSPARELRRRFDDALCARILASAWWSLHLSVLDHRDYSNVEGFLDRIERAKPPLFKPGWVRVVAERE